MGIIFSVNIWEREHKLIRKHTLFKKYVINNEIEVILFCSGKVCVASVEVLNDIKKYRNYIKICIWGL